jgi:hypothetical protein
MRFFSGVLCGMLLLALALFLADSWTTQDPSTANPPSAGRSDRIVNWDVAGERIYASLESMRERIHELTR